MVKPYSFPGILLKLPTTFLILLLAGFFTMSSAQITSSSMVGRVVDETGEPLIGANVVAIHVPSGTTYGTATNNDGRFTLPAMRVGGPYTLEVSYTGFASQKNENIFLSLGTAASFVIRMQSSSIELSGIVVTADRNDVFSSDRTGAALNVTAQQLNTLPTLNRNFIDFARLTPQASTSASGTSFGGQDNRFNNITIDGSLLNNSFGLTGEPGGRTQISAISLDAIEEVQINLAPFDVRQAGFVGAGINAVTRSGTNEFSGSVFYNVRNENLTGTQAGDATISREANMFTVNQYGARLGGPIIKNKLFFFVSAEFERQSSPYLDESNSGNETVAGNKTRVLTEDLEGVSAFMRQNFGYETGPYEGYDLETNGDKFLAKLDWSINNKHRASLRFNRLDSGSDVLISNSTSLGFGSRRTNGQAMSFRNSNYIQFDNITSVIGELNSVLSPRLSNNLIVGYTHQREDRGTLTDIFPLIEIQQDENTYISTGFDPFTPNNQLQYKTYQFQNNLSLYLDKHNITAGLSVERLEFRNVFFPGSQGVFVYNSLDDFYTDMNDYLDNPGRTESPVSLRRFQYRYSALPGGAEPVQPTEVTYAGLYVQDQISVNRKLTVTAGVRLDVPFFGDTGFENPQVSGMTFRDPEGNPIQTSTSMLPDPKLLFSPRLGFNLDLSEDRSFQLRGGTGIFTGRPAFVWISNQIGNNGVLTGFEAVDNTMNRPFTPTPGQFITNPSAPASYELNLTDENFKFPQVWRSNLAIDKKLPWNLVATVEAIYNQDINGILYQNINEEAATQTFNGPDNRPRYPGSGLSGSAANNALRINDNVTGAYYLTNQNEGGNYSLTVSLEKKFDKGLFGKVAYSFAESKNMVDPGSIAFGSYVGNPVVNGGNHPQLSFTRFDQRNRFLGAVSYRIEYANFGATQIGLFVNGANQGRFSHVVAGDLNGDGISNNDLLFVPNHASELNFEAFTSSGTTFTVDDQIAAFEAYIEQDEYLKTRRGNYAERFGGIFPAVWRADLSISQEFFIETGRGKRNTIQLRADIVNFTNFINSDWGVGNQIIANARPIAVRSINPEGEPVYRMATTGSGTSLKLLDATYQPSASLNFDVYRIQLGIRYTFN